MFNKSQHDPKEKLSSGRPRRPSRSKPPNGYKKQMNGTWLKWKNISSLRRNHYKARTTTPLGRHYNSVR